MLYKSTKYPSVSGTRLEFELIDAAGQTLGRLASRIAVILRGKDRVSFSQHLAAGRGVIVINAKQVKVTGKKLVQKVYTHHTGYRAGLRQKNLKDMLNQFPERVISYAVWGMLPKGPLGRQLLKRLKVYPGADHPQKAQLAAAGSAKKA